MAPSRWDSVGGTICTCRDTDVSLLTDKKKPKQHSYDETTNSHGLYNLGIPFGERRRNDRRPQGLSSFMLVAFIRSMDQRASLVLRQDEHHLGRLFPVERFLDSTASSDEERRWIHMTLEFTDFTNQFIYNGGKFIEKDEAQHLSVDTLHIEEGDSISAQQYAKLGKLIASTVQLLRDLYLSVAVADGAQELFDGLANAINLRKLTLYDCDSTDTDSEDSTRNSPAAELIIGDNGPLIRLLQNPLNQLKELCLTKLGLNDQHLIALSQLLPTCQIEVFDVSNNVIESEGMLEFARQLPRMHSLKHVRFGLNPWEDSETTSNTIGAALLQGIMENTSIESMDRDGLYQIPQGLLVWYYLVLNRAGRRLLVSSQTIPDGLWPLVLERAGNVTRYKGIDDMFGDSSSNGKCDDSSNDEMSDDSRIDKQRTARYNAVYFLCTSLQRHSPYCSRRQLEECETTASKYPRLEDEKSLRVDVAPDKEDVPCWAKILEQRLVAIEQGVQQLKNGGVKKVTGKLTPVIRLEDGSVPENFPATIVDLEHTDEGRIVELLRFYGLPSKGTLTEKMRSLKNFLGTNLWGTELSCLLVTDSWLHDPTNGHATSFLPALVVVVRGRYTF